MTDFPYWQREAFMRFQKKALWASGGQDTRSDEEITFTCTRVELEAFIHAHALAWVHTELKYMDLIKDEFGKYAIGMDISFLEQVLTCMANQKFINSFRGEDREESQKAIDKIYARLEASINEAKAKQKERE